MSEDLGVSIAVICIPYAGVVGLAYATLASFWKPFKRHLEDLLTCSVPNLVYLVLERIRERQGLYVLHAVAIITAVVCISLPLKGWLPRRRMLVALGILTAGCMSAVASWRFLPESKEWFKNAPGVW
jgi:hypothetical protein